MPWANERNYAVGEIARKQAAEIPSRTVSAANPGLHIVKLTEETSILPWNAPAGIEKISPVEASKRYFWRWLRRGMLSFLTIYLQINTWYLPFLHPLMQVPGTYHGGCSEGWSPVAYGAFRGTSGCGLFLAGRSWGKLEKTS